MNKIALSLMAVFGIALLGVGFISGFPGLGSGPNFSDLSEEEISEMQEFRNSVDDAIESGDYNSWRTLMISQFTEEKFDEVVDRYESMSESRALHEQLRQAIEDGDEETAEELRAQIDELIPEGQGHFMRGPGNGKGMQDCPFAES